MAFDWKNFLVLAEELAARNEESAKRSAISRAYYYVFNVAYARAAANGCIFVNEGKHKQCWTKYISSPEPACKQLGVRLRVRRTDADYEATTKVRLDDEVKATITEAKKFGTGLAALASRFPRD